MALLIGLPILVIAVIVLGATLYSLFCEGKPLLLKPRYKKRY